MTLGMRILLQKHRQSHIKPDAFDIDPFLGADDDGGNMDFLDTMNLSSSDSDAESVATSIQSDRESFFSEEPDSLASPVSAKRKATEKPISLLSILLENRPKKSKWMSNERIGQEELYPHLDAFLATMKAYTPYSLPFLNKVNKRDVPDYYTIITKPMDFGTMSRKLRNLDYSSKDDFVADFEQIITNCFLYNEEGSIYRGHAQRLKEKAAPLVRTIPDIRIRLRSQVLQEEKDLLQATVGSSNFEDEANFEEVIVDDRGTKEELSKKQILANALFTRSPVELGTTTTVPNQSSIDEIAMNWLDESRRLRIEAMMLRTNILKSLYCRGSDEKHVISLEPKHCKTLALYRTFLRPGLESEVQINDFICKEWFYGSLLPDSVCSSVSNDHHVWPLISREDIVPTHPPPEYHQMPPSLQYLVSCTLRFSESLFLNSEIDVLPANSKEAVDSNSKFFTSVFESPLRSQSCAQHKLKHLSFLLLLYLGAQSFTHSFLSVFSNIFEDVFLQLWRAFAKLRTPRRDVATLVATAQNLSTDPQAPFMACFKLMLNSNLRSAKELIQFKRWFYEKHPKTLEEQHRLASSTLRTSREDGGPDNMDALQDDVGFLTGNFREYDDLGLDVLCFKELGLGDIKLPSKLLGHAGAHEKPFYSTTSSVEKTWAIEEEADAVGGQFAPRDNAQPTDEGSLIVGEDGVPVDEDAVAEVPDFPPTFSEGTATLNNASGPSSGPVMQFEAPSQYKIPNPSHFSHNSHISLPKLLQPYYERLFLEFADPDAPDELDESRTWPPQIRH